MRKQTTALWILVAVVLTALILTACAVQDSLSGEPVHITVLYTNDEHGWMAATGNFGGATGMMHRWREDEGYSEDGAFLILGGGDTWTGPALSTWFDGESMIDVMNAMNYDAIAIGNHEFDFGLDGLRARAAQAEFPFLAANVSDTATGEPPDGVLPYILQDVAGVRVGIVGLASQRTPQTTMPTHVAGLEFGNYQQALARAVPEVRAEGAQVVLVISHLCGPEINALAPVAAELGVAMIGGGHCHEQVARMAEGVALVEAGWRMEAYGRVDLDYDPRTGSVENLGVDVKPNRAGAGSDDITDVVAHWQSQLDDALLVPIGYTADGIKRNSDAMYNMVTDAWLAAYPADIAMSNPGGFRQDIEPGEITLADIVGVLPFDNTLVDAQLTGQQVVASYQHGAQRPAVGGLTRAGSRFLVNGEPLEMQGTYHVLVNDFMYAGGDRYAFADYDPDAYMTGIDWRQPVIEWISALHTSPADPLENYLDQSRR